MTTLNLSGWHILDDPPIHVESEVVGADPLGDMSDSTYVQINRDGPTDTALGTCEQLASGGALPYDVIFHIRANTTFTYEGVTSPVGFFILGGGSMAATIDVQEGPGVNDYDFSFRQYAIDNALDPDEVLAVCRSCLESTGADMSGFEPQYDETIATVHEWTVEVVYLLPESSIDGSLRLTRARFSGS